MNLGGWEWVIIAVVALILFGGTKLAGIGKNAGRAIREFKEETQTLRDKPAVTGGEQAATESPVSDPERKPESQV